MNVVRILDKNTSNTSMNHQVSSPMSMTMDRPSGRVLVTGALGQIGTELVEALRQKHGREAVIATDIRKAEGWKILDVMNKKEIHKLFDYPEEKKITAPT